MALFICFNVRNSSIQFIEYILGTLQTMAPSLELWAYLGIPTGICKCLTTYGNTMRNFVFFFAISNGMKVFVHFGSCQMSLPSAYLL